MWIALACSYLVSTNTRRPWSCDDFTSRLAGVCDFSTSNADLCGGARKTGNFLDSLGRSTLNQKFGNQFVLFIAISLDHDVMLCRPMQPTMLCNALRNLDYTIFDLCALSDATRKVCRCRPPESLKTETRADAIHPPPFPPPPQISRSMMKARRRLCSFPQFQASRHTNGNELWRTHANWRMCSQ